MSYKVLAVDITLSPLVFVLLFFAGALRCMNRRSIANPESKIHPIMHRDTYSVLNVWGLSTSCNLTQPSQPGLIKSWLVFQQHWPTDHSP